MRILILLVGEQPSPNLLPTRYYKPERVGLVYTDLTKLRAERLATVLGALVQEPWCKTDAYRVKEIKEVLGDYVREQGWLQHELIFNLTGGTKVMALAAYEIARELNAAAFYFQTENNQSLIHAYRFDGGRLVAEDSMPISDTLTLDDYLKCYVGTYSLNMQPRDPFEDTVYQALRAVRLSSWEVMPAVYLTGVSSNVEVDMLVRYGNHVAVLEVKQTASKKGIDQLVSVTDQRTLGTYTHKLLVSATPLDENNMELAKAYRVNVIVLPSGKSGNLSPGDAEKLATTIKQMMEPKEMILLNFSHPLSAEQRAEIERLTGQRIEQVREIKTQVDTRAELAPQVVALVEACELDAAQWQTEKILIVPPSLSFVAATLLAELHGRMGYFPAMVRTRPVPDVLPPQYEIAEVINLQAVREAARKKR